MWGTPRPVTLTGMNTTTLPMRPDGGERLFTRAFALLTVAELAYFSADGVAIYTLPLYVTGPIGSDTAGAGIAFGAFAVSALLLRPLAGRFADTWGRRSLLLIGAVIAGLGLFLTPYAAGLGGVVALRLVLGVAEAAFMVAAFAAVADLAPASRMGEAISYNSLGLYLGLALGPLLGEALVRLGDFRTAWLGAAALAVLAAALVWTLPPMRPSTQDVAGPRRLIHWASVPICLAFLASIVAMGSLLAFAALHATDVGLRNASLPLVVYGTVVVVGRVAFARVVDRVPPLMLGAAALATMATGAAVIASWTAPQGLLVGAAVMATGMVFSTPAFFAAIFARTDAAQRGVAAGTATAFIDVGVAAGPIALGFGAQARGIPFAFALTAVVALLGSVWAVWLARPRMPVVVSSPAG